MARCVEEGLGHRTVQPWYGTYTLLCAVPCASVVAEWARPLGACLLPGVQVGREGGARRGRVRTVFRRGDYSKVRYIRASDVVFALCLRYLRTAAMPFNNANDLATLRSRGI